MISFDGMVRLFKFECLFVYCLDGLCLFCDGENVRFSIVPMITIFVFVLLCNISLFDVIGNFFVFFLFRVIRER